MLQVFTYLFHSCITNKLLEISSSAPVIQINASSFVAQICASETYLKFVQFYRELFDEERLGRVCIVNMIIINVMLQDLPLKNEQAILSDVTEFDSPAITLSGHIVSQACV